jgi:hypothetical protein
VQRRHAAFLGLHTRVSRIEAYAPAGRCTQAFDPQQARSRSACGTRPRSLATLSQKHTLHLQVRRLQTRRPGAIPPRNRHTERGRAVLGLNMSAPPGAAPSAAGRFQPVKLYRRQSARQIISAPVNHANHLGASQSCKSSRRQSTVQIISTAVNRANHLGASQPCKSSRRQSTVQIISTAVNHANHLDASQPVKPSRRQSARQTISTPVSHANDDVTRSALQMIVAQWRQGQSKTPLI